MIMANIKKPYDEKIKNAEYLFNQFKNELARTTQDYNRIVHHLLILGYRVYQFLLDEYYHSKYL